MRSPGADSPTVSINPPQILQVSLDHQGNSAPCFALKTPRNEID